MGGGNVKMDVRKMVYFGISCVERLGSATTLLIIQWF
jgi:hypothetical protein